METKLCIYVEDMEYPVDTEDQIRVAQEALRDAQTPFANVYVGSGPDQYQTALCMGRLKQ